MEENAKEVTVTFGKRLHQIRRERGVSMEQLSLDLGTTKATISRYENGLMGPSLDAAKKLADYFNISLDWLAGVGEESDLQVLVSEDYLEAAVYAIERNVSAQRIKKAVDLITDDKE